MFVHNMWAMPIEDGFAYCEYGALRTAPPLPYPSLQELPDMAETSIIVATSGPAHGGPPHQGPTSLSPGPVHHLAPSHAHPHNLALTHNSLQHLTAASNSSSSTTSNGQHLSHSSSLNSSVSSNGSGAGTLVVQPDGTTVTTNTATSTILTVRMIMQGKEVGSIIGKKGDNIKKFREESGAKINISDGSCPERIVTVTGSTENIQRAFGFICKKFEEFNSPCLPQQQDLQSTPNTPKPPVTLRLVVPASQCGSLIGKQGCKIKEIREATGASIQVASEMLPNSTERAVTVSGTADAITECIKYVCGIMLESPPKGANLPYRPKPLLSPLYIPGNQAFTVPASVASLPGQELSKGFPAPPVPMAHAIPMLPSAQNIVPGSLVPINGLGPAALPSLAPPIGTALGPALWPSPLPPPPPHQQPQPPHCLSLGPSLQYAHRAGAPPGPHHQQALPAPPGPQAQEMNIPNDLIGCIIGRGGQKINEIRQVSGATIKISNAEDGSSDRKVTITGPPECIGLAQYLISTSMELHKTLTLDPASLTPVSCVGGGLPPMPPHPMAMTVVKPLPPHHPGMMNFGGINGLSGLNGVAAAGVNMGAAINGINGFTGMPGLPPFLTDPGALTPSPPGMAAPGVATSMAIAMPSSSPLSPGGAKQLQTKMRVGLTATTAFKATERPKFAPY